MKTKTALLQLVNLICNQCQPSYIKMAQEKHPNLISTATGYSSRAITETEMDSIMSPDFPRQMQQKWITLFNLLDKVKRWEVENPELQHFYTTLLCMLLNLYKNFEKHYAYALPGDQKMPDIFLQSVIRYMQRVYLCLIKANENNPLLKAMLYPVLQLIKRTGKGNNTCLKVKYASTLLTYIRLWQLKKGTDEQLYEIAVGMNINSEHLLNYLFSAVEILLAEQETRQQKMELLIRWQYMHSIACCKKHRQHPVPVGLNDNEASLADTITNWLIARKTELQNTPAHLLLQGRLCYAHGTEFLSWHTRFETEAGLYQSPVVAHNLRALGQIISVPDTELPSVKNLEVICSRASIPEKTKNKLLIYGRKYLAIVEQMPTKEAQQKLQAKAAKDKNTLP